jgi:hypothetical protein
MHPADQQEPATGQLDLAWQPELADYIEAYGARNRARRAGLKIAVVAAILAVLVVVGVTTDTGSLVGAGIGGILALVVVRFVFQPRFVRSTWRANPALRAPARARVDPQLGVSRADGTSTGQVLWSGIDSVLETEHLFLIQLAGYRRKPFFVLAKRGLADPGQLADLRAILIAGSLRP